MTIRQRIKNIEKALQAGEKIKYLCVFYVDDSADGYKVQALPVNKGGNGGQDIFFSTYAEVSAFGARADIDLMTVQILYTAPND